VGTPQKGVEIIKRRSTAPGRDTNFLNVFSAFVKGNKIHLHMKLEETLYPLLVNSFTSFQL
jgi:hypothetical protein